MSKLINRIRLFKHSSNSDDELHEFFQIRKKKGWDIRKAWKMLQSVSDSDLSKFILPVLYRPFDVRWTFYHDSLVWRTVKRVMSHMMQENLGLITARSNKSAQMNHFFCTDQIMETKCGESTTQSCLFPLYILPDIIEKNKGRKPNISKKIFSGLSETYKTKPSSEDIFYYIYAVFYSNIYRTKYAQFLKTDFPRVPFTKDKHLFKKLAEYGKRLADLHLMPACASHADRQSSELDSPVAKFQGTGDKRVDKIKYDKNGKRVYINKDQYFEGIPENIWQYQIGGYQVCNKWLKDRKGKVLSLDDIKHYCKVATAIKHTINIQKSIDEIYNEAEKDLIGF